MLLVGRPYDLSRQVDRLAGLVCGFFPGEEGAQAIADVLSGRVNPSGSAAGQLPGRRLDPALDVPRLAAGAAQRGQRGRPDPALRLRPRAVVRRRHLGRGRRGVGSAVGHRRHLRARGALANEADRDVSEVVQVYLHDRSASVVRPVQQLVGAARVDLAPGQRARVRFALHADLTSFTGRDLVRIVEPGRGRAVGRRLEHGHPGGAARSSWSGPTRLVGADRALEPAVTVETG